MTGRVVSRLVSALFVLFALAFAGTASAKIHNWYWTTDPGAINTSPCSGGSQWNDSTVARPASLDQGEKIWIAICNNPDPARKKIMTIDVYNAIANYNRYYTKMEGFMTDDTSQPVKTRQSGGGMIGWVGILTDSWVLKPQPKWERFEMTPSTPVDEPAKRVRVATVCRDTLDYEGNPYLEIDYASFGGSANAAGDPRMTEIWVFPRTGSVSVTPPTFTAPPATGTWVHSTVLADPEGTSRPGGGIRFSTSGTGLSPTDQFSARVHLNESNVVRYNMFVYDATSGTYLRFSDDNHALDVPGVGTWGYVALVFALAVAGIAVTRRRRAALA